MDKITRVAAARVGVDLSKRVIQVHAVDEAGRVLANRTLSRDKFLPWCGQLASGCMAVMEVSSSAHHWARRLQAMGLDVRIVSAHLAAVGQHGGQHGISDQGAVVLSIQGKGHSSAVVFRDTVLQVLPGTHV